MKDYPTSYSPQDTCFNCEYNEQIDGKHIAECKKYDILVAIWCKCDAYEKGERFKE
jgi:hypothetical protein